jgi:hypothetical protein
MRKSPDMMALAAQPCVRPLLLRLRSNAFGRQTPLYLTSVGATLMLLNGDPLISFVLITV